MPSRGAGPDSASAPGWVRALRERPEGHRVRGLGTLWCAEYSPDGARLASGGSVGVVLWDLRERRVLARLALAIAPVTAIAFSRDGGRLAAAGDDGQIAVCDLGRMETTAVLRPRRGDDDEPYDPELPPRLQFSPDGGALLVLEATQAWLAVGDAVRRVAGPRGALGEDAVVAGFSVDGELVVLRDESTSLVAPVIAADGKLRFKRRRDLSFRAGPGVAACSDDGRVLLAPAMDGGEASHAFVSLATGELLGDARLAGEVHMIRFVADARVALVSASGGSAVLAVPTHDDAPSLPLRALGGGLGHVLAIAPSGEQLAVAGDYGGYIRLCDRDGREVAPSLGRYIADSEGAVSLVSLDARAASALLLGFVCDGQNSYTWAQDWDLVGDRPGRTLSDSVAVLATAAALVPDTDLAALPVHRGGVLLVARETGAERPLAHAVEVHSMTTARGGGLVVGGSVDGELVLWDRDSGDQLACVRAHRASICGLGVHPGGEQLATCSQDGTVRLWTLSAPLAGGTPRERHDEAPLATPRATAQIGAMPRQVAFSPDGQLCAIGTARGEVCLLHVADATIAARIDGHEGEVMALAFHPRTGELVTGGFEGSVKVWDPRTGALHHECIHEGPVLDYAPDHGVTGMGFDADGRVLVVSHADGTIRLWDLPTDAPADPDPAASDQGPPARV